MKKTFRYFFVLGLFSPIILLASTHLNSAKFIPVKNGVVARFTFNSPVKYHYFSLSKPDRFVLDFDKTITNKKIKLNYSGGIVKNIRVSNIKNQLRLVFDLNASAKARIILKNKTLTMNLVQIKKQRVKRRSPSIYLSAAQFNKLKPKAAMVVIDPGHGGKDPGATGPKGIHEKNVVLEIAKDLRADLKPYKTINVDMTRKGDYFVTLRGRLAVARKDKANVFVAIHADSFYNRTARGASVFALSEHGASSEAARWLASSENYSVLGGAKFKDRSRAVRSVLLDLSQAVTIQDSLNFGKDIYASLKKVTDMHTYHVEQAPFVVLKSPDIPSLLVETGFISNPFEEHRLNSSPYQHTLGMALKNGIVKYLYQHPPHDSLIAWQQAGKLKVTLKKKTSLASLARAYNVSILSLQKANATKAKNFKRGEKIQIPQASV